MKPPMQKKRGPSPVHPTAYYAWKRHKPLARGGVKALAEHLNISTPAVSKWPYVPRERLDAVAAFLHLEPGDLRPDLDPFSALTKGN